MNYYVVSLRRRGDRRSNFFSQVPTEVTITPSYEIGGDFDHLDSIRIACLDIGFFPWKIENNNPWWSRHMKYGEIACALNHLACWRHALQSNASHAVIFEDDTIFDSRLFFCIPDLVHRLNSIDAEWGILYLGREKIGEDLAQIKPFVRPGFSYCTYAYILSRTGISALLSYKLDQRLMPLDEFLAATYMEHPRTDVRQVIRPAVHAYALAEDCVTEADDRVLGSDTEASAQHIPFNSRSG